MINILQINTPSELSHADSDKMARLVNVLIDIEEKAVAAGLVINCELQQAHNLIAAPP
ncbi:MAG: hypothetical protein JKY94_10085 [Rhodobacteraceae bacterium]|nr:hypothetical protein [Paracoccaceae bacterium]